MKKSKIKIYLGSFATYLSRLGMLPPNFSPLGSFGFFSQSLIPYFVSIIAFDLLVGGFYKGQLFTYLGFFSYYLFGKLAGKNRTKQALLLPLASLSFFVLSNFGSWYFWYPHTTSGLIACYLAALPFYKNTLLSDLIFGYGYLSLKHFQKAKKENRLKNWSIGEYQQIQLGKN